jgi:hypothetical protein
MPPDRTIPSNEEPFFEDKPIEYLFGEGIKAEEINTEFS